MRLSAAEALLRFNLFLPVARWDSLSCSIPQVITGAVATDPRAALDRFQVRYSRTHRRVKVPPTARLAAGRFWRPAPTVGLGTVNPQRRRRDFPAFTIPRERGRAYARLPRPRSRSCTGTTGPRMFFPGARSLGDRGPRASRTACAEPALRSRERPAAAAPRIWLGPAWSRPVVPRERTGPARADGVFATSGPQKRDRSVQARRCRNKNHATT